MTEHDTSHTGPQGPTRAMTERVQRSFMRQGLMRLLGAELAEVRAGVVTIRLNNRPELSQQHGSIHAGASGAIADSAGGYAALSLMDDNSEVVTVDYTLNLLAPARGDRVEATGTVLRPGRTLTVCRLEVWSIDATHRTLVAAGQQTLMRVRT